MKLTNGSFNHEKQLYNEFGIKNRSCMTIIGFI
jgi:hypothetical protein